MAPIVLHGVADDELYIGDDGHTRPYALVNDAHRRRVETGSFGKSTRRSRSRASTPALGRRNEDATIAAADIAFGEWFSTQPVAVAPSSAIMNAKTDHIDGGGYSTTAADRQHPHILDLDDSPLTVAAAAAAAAAAASAASVPHKQPTEVVLRGYRSSKQQYAAVNHYEQIAGRICEDYPRSPPAEQRRYRSELRDRAVTERRRLTPEERAKVNRPAGGEHWIKVTFESADAADLAIHTSPQHVLGHLVYCELWTGSPPPQDEAVVNVDTMFEDFVTGRSQSAPTVGVLGQEQGLGKAGLSQQRQQQQQHLRRGGGATRGHSVGDLSPPDSRTSSRTVETATLTTSDRSATVTDTTLMGEPAGKSGLSSSSLLATRGQGTNAGTGTGTGLAPSDPLFCRRIPTARRVTIRPADEALLPRQTFLQWLVTMVPILQWFTGSMIGNEVPRRESGDFDYDRASLYWKVIWWLDVTFRLFGGEISTVEKDE